MDLKVYHRGVTSTYNINEVARRSGFTPATLRYYEDIGLVPSETRTDSGYRQYGDEVLDRPITSTTGDADVAIACTATAQSATKALQERGDLLASQHDSIVRCAIARGVRVRFGSGIDIGELARLTLAEQECCRFFSFAITVDRRGVGLEVVAPDDALPSVHALFGVPV